MAPSRFAFGLALALPSAGWAQVPAFPAPALESPHSFSPEVAAMLAERMPKFDAFQASTPTPAAPALSADGIIRLPSFVVIDRRLPTSIEVMSPEELTRYAINKYLGPEDGIDRGVLNLVTVRQFWDKIPILGQFPLPGFETNGQRALRLYHEDVRRQEQADLTYLSEFTKETGRSADAGAMKRAVQAGFTRDPNDLPHGHGRPALDPQN